MTAWRRAIELSIGGEDLAKLVSIARSRTEQASRVERARMLLAYREDPSFFAVGRALGASSDGPALRRAGVGRPGVGIAYIGGEELDEALRSLFPGRGNLNRH